MTVQRLIEELQKLPANTLSQEIEIRFGNGSHEIANVRWEGNRVELEMGHRYA